MKFRSDKITGLFHNEGDVVGATLRAMDSATKIVVSEGFGVPQSGNCFPLRFLAYIIPVLHILRQLPPSAIVEFYFATQGVIRANGNSPWWHMGNLCDSVMRMANVIHNYVKEVHPAVASRVRVLHDRVVYSGSPTEQLIEKLLEVADRVATDRVRAFAEKRGGKRALRYMVEHMLYMRDDYRSPAGLFLGLVPDMIERSEFDTLIMVGGPSERIFYELRQSLQLELGDDKPHAQQNNQFFTPIGDPPTYHLQDGEPTWEMNRPDLRFDGQPGQSLETMKVEKLFETTFDKVRPDMGVRRAVMHDLLVLLNDAGGSNDFRWCRQVATNLDKGRKPELPLEVLQRGWNVIRSLH